MLPGCFPPRQTVYGWFADCRDKDVWEALNRCKPCRTGAALDQLSNSLLRSGPRSMEREIRLCPPEPLLRRAETATEQLANIPARHRRMRATFDPTRTASWCTPCQGERCWHRDRPNILNLPGKCPREPITLLLQSGTKCPGRTAFQYSWQGARPRSEKREYLPSMSVQYLFDRIVAAFVFVAPSTRPHRAACRSPAAAQPRRSARRPAIKGGPSPGP